MGINVTGLILPAAALAFGSIQVKPFRAIYPILEDGQMDDPLVAQVTIEERHHDELEITNHPIEQGANVTDHSYKHPAELAIEIGWSNSPSVDTGILGTAVGVGTALGGQTAAVIAAAVPTYKAVNSLLTGNGMTQVQAIYQKILELQASRKPFIIFTGKRNYSSMLFKSLDVLTDARSENTLMLRCVCRQVIIVQTQTLLVPINTKAQGQPQKTTPITNKGQTQLQAR